MSKLPEWFPLDVYQRDLSPMEWAFEIFIRLEIRDKVDFIVRNLSFSDSYIKNTLNILSRTLPNFLFDDALKVVNENIQRFIDERTAKGEGGQRGLLFYDEDRARDERCALNDCLKLYCNLNKDYQKLLSGLPIHLLLDNDEKQHLFKKFLEEHRNIQAHPLVFHRNPPMRTLEADDFFYQNATAYIHKSYSGEQCQSYHLDEGKAADYDMLLVRQPKSFAERNKRTGCPYFRPNLAFSDKEILDAVANLLAQYRVNEAQGKTKLMKQLPKWKEYQVLALWDLTEWGNKWTGRKFTQPELAVALWPYASRPIEAEVDYVDRIKKLSKRDMNIAIKEETYLLLLQTDLTLVGE